MKPRAAAGVFVVLALAALAAWWAANRDAPNAPPRTPATASAASPAAGRADAARLVPDPLLDVERVAVPAGGEDVEHGSEIAIPDAAEAVEAPAPTILRGRATFAHGGPVADAQLVATEPTREHAPSGLRGPEWFGFAVTGADGRFEMAISDAGVARGACRLLLQSSSPWASDLSVHPIDGVTEAAVVIEGAQLGVRVVDGHGQPSPKVKIRAEFTSDDPAREVTVAKPWTADHGRALVAFRGAGEMRVRAVTQDGRLGAGPVSVHVDDRVAPEDLQLVITPEGRTGRIAVEVVDRAGMPVEHFAVRIDDGEHFDSRFVHGEDLAPGGFVEELAYGRARLTLDWRFRAPRNLYAKDLHDPVWVDVVPDAEPPRVRFVVELLAGLVIDLRRPEEPAGSLVARVRRADRAADDWTPVRSLWLYGDESALSTSVPSESGRYYLPEQQPGWLVLEFLDAGSRMPVHRAEVELHAGRYAEIVVER